MANTGTTLDNVIKIGGFVVGIIGLISSIGIPFFIRFRKKLKFVDYRLIIDDRKITAITFTIKNKTMKILRIYEIGLLYKDKVEKYPLIQHPRGTEYLRKEQKDISTGYDPPSTERAQNRTEAMKQDINRLYIKHNLGNDYIYRRIDLFKKKIEASGILFDK